MLFPIASTHDSFGEMRTLLRQMDEVFNDLNRAWSNETASEYPDMGTGFRDEGAQLVFSLDLPGMSEDAIEIDANEAGLIIRANYEAQPPEGFTALRREIPSGSVTRALSWPTKVDLDGVEASIRDGVLTVRAMKEPAAQPKTITVKAS